ncbi:MAG: desulfoferrodoxin family protein [Lachnospiraceae bacterium]|nr:desulfoferrodoxin family protein [Lachnospiraceae bacterium]
MCSKQKFFICKHCGNLIGLIENKGVPMVCCGEEMTELIPNTVEASVEKHLPVVSALENKMEVAIGSIPHPMEEAHHIDFVYVETENGGQRKCLKVGQTPKALFSFEEDKPIAVYAYCNLHGLWKTELK